MSKKTFVVKNLPASKSISARVLIVKALCDFDLEIENLSDAQDTQFLSHVLNQSPNQTVYVGEGGTTLRFFLAYAVAKKFSLEIWGSKRLNERPISYLVEALRHLGAAIDYLQKPGFTPLRLKNFSQCQKQIQIGGDISSQFVSALMLIAPVLPLGLEIRVKKPIVSKSYIELTQSVLEFFSIRVQSLETSSHFNISIENQTFKPRAFRVEKDWSSASYWYSLAAFMPEFEFLLQGLNLNSLQADRVMADLAKDFGIISTQTDSGLLISKNFEIVPEHFQMDCTLCPDLAPTLAFLCTGLKVPFRLSGLSTLRVKETDRILALNSELSKLGAATSFTRDSITAEEFGKIEDRCIQSHSDHRMVMSAAVLMPVLGLAIEEPHWVGKSYPKFWQDYEEFNSLLNN